jgi:membrane protein implicated in regulation of membrane protease activity
MVRMMKSRDKEDVRTNADAIIGRTAIVSEEIKAGSFGRVALDGDDWKATATTDIAKGEQVEIISRESIILTVNKLNNN